jgi:hypothetical protein
VLASLGGTGGGTSAGTGGGTSGGGTSSGGGYVTMTGPLGNQVVSVAAGDPCAGIALMVTEANTIIGECTDLLRQNPPLPAFTELECRRRLPDCSSLDRQAGDQFLNCLRRLEPCTNANRRTFESRADLCVMSYAGNIQNRCMLSLRY